jgi:hypothetical protein
MEEYFTVMTNIRIACNLDHGDASQIDRIARILPGETADPGSSGFPNIALDEGTGVNEIHRHVNAARE